MADKVLQYLKAIQAEKKSAEGTFQQEGLYDAPSKTRKLAYQALESIFGGDKSSSVTEDWQTAGTFGAASERIIGNLLYDADGNLAIDKYHTTLGEIDSLYKRLVIENPSAAHEMGMEYTGIKSTLEKEYNKELEWNDSNQWLDQAVGGVPGEMEEEAGVIMKGGVDKIEQYLMELTGKEVFEDRSEPTEKIAKFLSELQEHKNKFTTNEWSKRKGGSGYSSKLASVAMMIDTYMTKIDVAGPNAPGFVLTDAERKAFDRYQQYGDSTGIIELNNLAKAKLKNTKDNLGKIVSGDISLFTQKLDLWSSNTNVKEYERIQTDIRDYMKNNQGSSEEDALMSLDEKDIEFLNTGATIEVENPNYDKDDPDTTEPPTLRLHISDLETDIIELNERLQSNEDYYHYLLKEADTFYGYNLTTTPEIIDIIDDERYQKSSFTHFDDAYSDEQFMGLKDIFNPTESQSLPPSGGPSSGSNLTQAINVSKINKNTIKKEPDKVEVEEAEVEENKKELARAASRAREEAEAAEEMERALIEINNYMATPDENGVAPINYTKSDGALFLESEAKRRESEKWRIEFKNITGEDWIPPEPDKNYVAPKRYLVGEDEIGLSASSNIQDITNSIYSIETNENYNPNYDSLQKFKKENPNLQRFNNDITNMIKFNANINKLEEDRKDIQNKLDNPNINPQEKNSYEYQLKTVGSNIDRARKEMIAVEEKLQNKLLTVQKHHKASYDIKATYNRDIGDFKGGAFEPDLIGGGRWASAEPSQANRAITNIIKSLSSEVFEPELKAGVSVNKNITLVMPKVKEHVNRWLDSNNVSDGMREFIEKDINDVVKNFIQHNKNTEDESLMNKYENSKKQFNEKFKYYNSAFDDGGAPIITTKDNEEDRHTIHWTDGSTSKNYSSKKDIDNLQATFRQAIFSIPYSDIEYDGKFKIDEKELDRFVEDWEISGVGAGLFDGPAIKKEVKKAWEAKMLQGYHALDYKLTEKEGSFKAANIQENSANLHINKAWEASEEAIEGPYHAQKYRNDIKKYQQQIQNLKARHGGNKGPHETWDVYFNRIGEIDKHGWPEDSEDWLSMQNEISELKKLLKLEAK